MKYMKNTFVIIFLKIKLCVSFRTNLTYSSHKTLKIRTVQVSNF